MRKPTLSIQPPLPLTVWGCVLAGLKHPCQEPGPSEMLITQPQAVTAKHQAPAALQELPRQS